MEVHEIAKVAHEVNRVYCLALGDVTQPSWDDAEEWQRASAIKGVLYHQDNPSALPSDSHNSWLKEKKETGWVYGAVKSSFKKEHPCCVPYLALPVEQRAKDFIFGQIVKSLTGGIN